MNSGYRWVLDEESYRYLCRLSPGQRRRAESALDLLAAHPFTEPSYIDFDSEGEELFHRFVGRHTIVYHVDHAVRRIWVLQICPNP